MREQTLYTKWGPRGDRYGDNRKSGSNGEEREERRRGGRGGGVGGAGGGEEKERQSGLSKSENHLVNE